MEMNYKLINEFRYLEVLVNKDSSGKIKVDRGAIQEKRTEGALGALVNGMNQCSVCKKPA